MYISDFLDRSIRNSLKDEYSKINLVNKIEKVGIIDALKLSKIINKSDSEIVMFNTLQNDWFFYLILFLFIKKDKLLSIHNINAFCKSPTNLKGIVRYFIRKIVVKQSKYINVYGENMKEYLREMGFKKKITTLPFSHFYGIYETKISDDKIKIVIPGGFTTRRRDYYTVYEVIKKLENENIELNLLGKVTDRYSEELFKKFKKLKNVITYDSFVSEKEFDKVMCESDLILGPTEKFIEFEAGVKENYGITKETGFTFAQITYSKFGVTPNYIEVMDELKTSTLTYKNSEELYEILKNFLVKKDNFKKLKEQAFTNSQYFTSEKIRERFLKEIN